MKEALPVSAVAGVAAGPTDQLTSMARSTSFGALAALLLCLLVLGQLTAPALAARTLLLTAKEREQQAKDAAFLEAQQAELAAQQQVRRGCITQPGTAIEVESEGRAGSRPAVRPTPGWQRRASASNGALRLSRSKVASRSTHRGYWLAPRRRPPWQSRAGIQPPHRSFTGSSRAPPPHPTSPQPSPPFYHAAGSAGSPPADGRPA